MREAYLPELSEMYQKIFMKIQQHESLPQQPKSEQLEKLKAFKRMLERVIAVLQVNKADIGPSLKEKLVHYEKQILNFINANRPRKVAMQQGQLPAPHIQMQQQQSQPQITQVQSHENQMNPQLQSMNLQGSVASMLQNNMGNWHHNFMSSLSGVSNAQQTMIQQQPAQLQQQVGLQQQANLLQRDMLQRLQASGSLFQQQNVIDQQMQLYPSQTPLSETPTSKSLRVSIDSSAQTGHLARGDWQEAAYQKHESLPQQLKSEQLEKLKAFKGMLERVIAVLQLDKVDIVPSFKEKLVHYEKQIINFINASKARKVAMQQG
ncbi:hypothetical protein NL676_005153 [Syzygium grande]|nr:hypothetical protein NL676_005153 [Syzygium grande]